MAQTSKVTGVATKIVTENGTTRVIYHRTAVVTFDETEIILESNGWQTATTKTRMNQAAHQFGLGFYVYQRKGNWFVDHEHTTYEYRDGLILKRA